MRIDHYHYFVFPGLTERLAEISQKLDQVLKKETHMSQEIDNLEAGVKESVTVQESAIALLGNLSQQIQDLKNDPIKLQALADSLGAEKQRLADAITVNTPAAPAAE